MPERTTPMLAAFLTATAAASLGLVLRRRRRRRATLHTELEGLGLASWGDFALGVAARNARRKATVLKLYPLRVNPKQSKQGRAFGTIMMDISRGETDFASRILTTAPDVTTTTNLTGFVNKRGVYGRDKAKDVFNAIKGVFSMNKFDQGEHGQHVELGIAEMNLMLLLGAAGLSGRLFGQRLLPVGTLYDPFIARALDALNYGCYQDARFMLLGTPSGITLGPEGGAHQSTNTQLIGTAMPNMKFYEPAYADELKAMMQHGFEYMQAPAGDGGSIGLRLSTRNLTQPDRDLAGDATLLANVLNGGYWHVPPTDATEVVVAFCGAIAPEAVEGHARLGDATAALLQVTSPDVLCNEWRSDGQASHAAGLMKDVPRDANVVTVLDGHPAGLSWLGAVCGHRVTPLGVSAFGQSGDLPDLYRHYEIDAEAIAAAAKQ